MTTKLNIVISLIIFLIIITYNIILKKKNNKSYKDTLYNKSTILKRISYIISFFMFIISLIINIVVYGADSSIKTTITYIMNSLSITILFLPLSLEGLYDLSFNDEEKYSHIKTVITNIIDKKIIKKLNRAGINVLLLTEEPTDLKYSSIEEEEINKNILKKNIIIKTNNLKIVDSLIDKESTLKEFKDLNELYNKIYTSRGIHDNYIRTIKYLIATYLPLFISYLFLNIIGFPIEYNILLVLLLKVFTIYTSHHLYRKLPYDTDIMIRKPKAKNIFIGKQELSFTIIESLCIFFMLNTPYMYVISQGGTQSFGNSLFLIIFMYCNLFLTYSYLSESNIIKNIFKSLTNLRLVIFTLVCIAITLILNFTTYFNTRNIELHNFIACIFFGIIAILLNELTKLARFTTTKGKKKNEHKNHKKRK